MKFYKIKELSKLTSTTVRMLQFYDEIDLLKPSRRSSAGYRLYSDEDLLCLQQILTLKYLGYTLIEIKNIIKARNFNVLKSLKFQSQILSDKAVKIQEASKLLKYLAAQIEAGEKINWVSASVITNILEVNTMKETLLKNYKNEVTESDLGKGVVYDQTYSPDRLYPIPRAGKRQEIGIDPDNLPFSGFDCWNHYEVSWLNEKGKPIAAIAEIYYDCLSPQIIESKSLKLYFNSFNYFKFKSVSEIEVTVKNDLEKAINSPVIVKIHVLNSSSQKLSLEKLTGECIDDLDVECKQYTVDPTFLAASGDVVTETLFSDLLKSNCLVTNQPDWGSVQISYTGEKINREGLLKYIVSFRNHNEFHEQCIERIFVDIMTICKPTELTVYGRYTRRGGIDINPYRSTKKVNDENLNQRLIRQ